MLNNYSPKDKSKYHKKQKREMAHTFGDKKATKPRTSKKKDSGALAMLKIEKQQSLEHEVNQDDIYRRTRRLLKKVDAVPSSVRVIDNQSSMNVTNAGFPDLNFISPDQFKELAALTDAEEAKSPTAGANGHASYDNINNGMSPISENGTDGDLPGIAENKEDEMTTPKLISGMITPISAKHPTHRSTNSISTPFGDMDTNTMINLRAKHRRTSSLMKRTSSEFSMKNYAEIVWNRLAVVSGRGDTLTQRQFDIELQNNEILADPDMGKDLFLTIQSDNPVNKKQINKEDFQRVCAELDKIPLIDEIASDTLQNKEDQKILIVLKQVFVHIAQNEPFDINAYLTVKLSKDDLNNVDLLINKLSSRELDWTTRLQILKWITANLETSESLRALTSDDNIGPFLLGWMCQCLDERSGLAKSALEMFPNVLSITMTQTGEAFQYLDDIFSSLFLVIRNKRSKDLNETANDCCIQCVDMIMDWHEHGELDNEVLLEICHIFRDNTNAKEMKHDKVRERCVAYFGYIVFGIQGQSDDNGGDQSVTSPMDEEKDTNTLTLLAPKSNHVKAKSADYARTAGDADEKWVQAPRASLVGHKTALKISKTMKRKYLLNKETHAQFIEYMNDALGNGLNDKSGDTRTTAFRLLDKLEKVELEDGKKALIDIFTIDAFALSKFNKWKERKSRKGGKGRKKKSNRTRIKNHNHLKKTSVTLTIGAQ